MIALLLVCGALTTAGLAYGRPSPAYSTATVRNGWLNGATVFHPDAFAYVGLPYQMLLRRTFNPRYFHNPSLSIYLNMALLWASGSASQYHNQIDPLSAPPPDAQAQCASGAPPHPICVREIAPFSAYVMAQYVAALTTLLGVALAFASGRALASPGVGLLTAALVGLSPLITQHAHYALPSALTFTCSTAAFALTILLLRTPRPGLLHFVAAGLSVGLTTSARYNAAVVGLPVAVAMLVAWWRHRAWAGLILGGMAVPVGFVLGTPGAVFAFSAFISDVRGILDWYRTQGGGAGFTVRSAAEGYFHHWRYVALIVVGPAALLLGGIGVWGRRWQQGQLGQLGQLGQPLILLNLMWLAYLAVYTILALPGTRLNANLLIPMIVPLALLAAQGVLWVWGRTGKRRWVLAALGVALIGWPALLSVQLAVRFATPDNRMAAQAWVFAHVPRQTAIHLLGSYNVPLDPLEYRVTQTYGTFAAAESEAWDAPVIVYSDALPWAALRDPSLVPDQREWEALQATSARLQREWRELARFPRLAWAGAGIPPDDVSVWHHMEIVVYCHPSRCPVRVD
jgi:4-amino-4-deoxy-L-arabinose transferase-like glycosyltransferase